MSNGDRVFGIFSPVEEQIANAQRWNRERRWGLDLWPIPPPPALWPNSRLAALTLTPYLPDGGGVTGVQRTFEELVFVMESQLGHIRRFGDLQSDPAHLALLRGVRHEPGFRWETIDLGANIGHSVINVRDPRTAPHADALAAICQHPGWVRAMNMDNDYVPHIQIAGYQVTASGDVSPRHVPTAYWRHPRGYLELNIRRERLGALDYAVPIRLALT